MAGKTIDMSKLRKVIKLYVGGKSKVFISTYLGLSRNTVKKYIKQFNGLKVTFEELDRLSDLDLDELFNLPQEKELSQTILNYFDNRSTNASAESFNAKIKAFRAQFRGVRNVDFFLFRLTQIYA